MLTDCLSCAAPGGPLSHYQAFGFASNEIGETDSMRNSAQSTHVKRDYLIGLASIRYRLDTKAGHMERI